MITNLVASVVVSLVTNVTERVPQHSEPEPCPRNGIGCLMYHSKMVNDANPTKKWIKTTVQCITKATFEWKGKPREVVDEEVVSEVEVEHALSSEWSAVKTNELSKVPIHFQSAGYLMLTNRTR